MTAKEKLLAEAKGWTEEQAEAALRMVAAQAELAAYLEQEARLAVSEVDAREDRWAEANARQAIREERW